MSTENYESTIRSLLAASFGDSSVAADLGADVSLLDLGFNSLMAVKLATLLEQKFGISVGADERQPENFSTLAKIVAYVSKKTHPSMDQIKKPNVKDTNSPLTVEELINQLIVLTNQVGSSAMVLVQIPGQDTRFTEPPTIQGGIVFINGSTASA